jgi:Na+/H+ antiporter NhaA
VEPNIGEQIKRRLNQVLVATVALYIVVIVVAWLAWRQSSGDHAALCAFKGGLENQVSASDAFLKKHPTGVGGISAGDIRLGMKRQQRTIDSLSNLKCD